MQITVNQHNVRSSDIYICDPSAHIVINGDLTLTTQGKICILGKTVIVNATIHAPSGDVRICGIDNTHMSPLSTIAARRLSLGHHALPESWFSDRQINVTYQCGDRGK